MTPVDGDAGVGVGTAVTCAVPGAAPSIAEPLKYTLLSLPYYAKIMGINPVHFQGADGGDVFPIKGTCNDVWPRYSWQASDRLSREELARAIYDAEQDIARELGYYPAPYWIAQEQHRFPRHHRRDVFRGGGLNVRGARVSIRTRYGKFIEAGQRAVSLIGTASTASGLTYSDEDGDGFAETATITLATSLTDACEIKAYFTGTSAAQEWEIRPAKSKTISGGFVTMVFPSWLFIDPDLQAVHPTMDSFRAVDISTTANFVTAVDVYREYNDPTENSATFFWEPSVQTGLFCSSCGGTGCVACTLTSQDGCIHVRDVENGVVVPQPATYSAGDWSADAYSVCRDPDMVRLYYYAGDQDNRYLSGFSCEPLSNYWAHAIAWLATARLNREFCSCGNVLALANELREDLARSGEVSYQFSLDLLNNPFGTRRGAVMAWQRVTQIQGRSLKGGAV